MEDNQSWKWTNVVLLCTYQILVVLSVPYYLYSKYPSLLLLFYCFVLFVLTGLSITVGYHRCFSHRAFEGKPLVKLLLLFFGAMACQGSALRWSFEHRLHHAHVDTDKDPYCIKKGFWYAHMLWLFEPPLAIVDSTVRDLLKDRWVSLQHRLIVLAMFVTNILAYLFVSYMTQDFKGTLVFAVGLRIFVLHHVTWFINSLAHTWGAKTYCKEMSAVDNFFIAFVTFGEGYHNYHHVFSRDYRNGILWWHFDPSKWVIFLLNRLYLVTNLKMASECQIKKRLIHRDKDLILKKIEGLFYLKKEVLENKIEEISQKIVEELSQKQALLQKYHMQKKQKSYEHLKHLKQEIRILQDVIQKDWKQWIQLCKGIMDLEPIPG